MRKRKRILIGITFALLMALSFNITAIAAEGLNEVAINQWPDIIVDDSVKNTDNQQDSSFFIPIQDENESPLSSEIQPSAAGTAGWYVIRSGDTTKCELYFYWTGDISVLNWRYLSITVAQNTLLNPVQYKKFGTPPNYNLYEMLYGTGMAGTAKVGDLSIPTNITSVRVSCTGLQYYDPVNGFTSVSINISGGVVIN